MTVLRNTGRITSALAVLLVISATAQAAVTRFISFTGNDANTCARTTPCRTLQRGVDSTPEGGELKILDPGGTRGSAPADIARSITISADGFSATLAGVRINGSGGT